MRYQWFSHYEKTYKASMRKKPTEAQLIDAAQFQHDHAESIGDGTGMESSRAFMSFYSELRYLALDKEVLEHIEKTGLKSIDGQSLHFPHKHYSLGLPMGFSNRVRGVTFHWVDYDYWFERIRMTTDHPGERHLFVYLDCVENGELYVVRECIPESRINDFLLSGSLGQEMIPAILNITDSKKTMNYRATDDEKIEVNRICRIVLKLGLLMSIKEAKLMPLIQKRDLPKNVKTAVKLTLDLPKNIGMAGHFVTGHLRQLKDKKYYQNQWSEYPVGTRYSYVSAHLRGIGGVYD